MLPAPFELHRPKTIDEAFALMAQHSDDATFYAGGTEMLVAMKARVVAYPHVIDIKGLNELRGVTREADGTLRIGGLSTHHELATNPMILEHLPAYAAMSNQVANIRVRVAGTVAGNLCFAEPHADVPTLLCALGAQLVLRSPRGERTVDASEFIIGEFTTIREDDELLTAIRVPPTRDGTTAAYRNFGHLERPAVGVAVRKEQAASGVVWHIWVGAVCGCPVRLEAVEAAVRGMQGEQAREALKRHIDAAAQELEIYDSIHGSADYKRHLVGVLANRAMEACQK